MSSDVKIPRWAMEKLTGSVTLLPVLRTDGGWVKYTDHQAALIEAEAKGAESMRERAAQQCNLAVYKPVSDGQKVETPAEGAYYMAEKLFSAIRNLETNDAG